MTKIKKRALTGYHWDDVEELYASQHSDGKEMKCLIRFYDWIVKTCLEDQIIYQATYAAGEVTPDDVTHAEINEDEDWLRAFNFLVSNNLITPKNGFAGYEFTFIL